MAAHQSPQLGYNHNIPHRGRLYHVQTEDSGRTKAHIFTHIFFDGTIIASHKEMYTDLANAEDSDSKIIGIMQKSHKVMIRALRSGRYDEKIVSYIGPHPKEGPEKASEKPAAKKPEAKPKKPAERRPPPPPREVAQHGPPLKSGAAGPTIDPSVSHPVYNSAEAQTQVAAAAAGQGRPRPTRGPKRLRRRAVGGIGGKGVTAGTPPPITHRRDVIVGKFASEHQAQLDEEILALLREE